MRGITAVVAPPDPPIHRIAARIGIAVGPHARLGDLPPVGLEEHQKVGVVVAGVEILQPRLGIIALADVAVAFGGGWS